jgi:DNA polymerase-3 subunit delta'
MSRVLDGAIEPAANTRLFGHEQAEDFLAGAYRSGRIHHAVLIEGPEGIGKATLAFRFARHVLDHPDPASAPATLADGDPNSPTFRQIVAGASHHVLHLTRPIDEKTGRVKSAVTVDEVRRAGRLFSQTTGTGGWRIIIVDPADDLNRSAANAILKMLEEPPRRSLFLVVSHAPGKLLPTIRSRCLTLRLNPLSSEALAAAVAHLPAASTVSPADLQKIIARADGSVARALMMISYGGLDILQAYEKALANGGDRKAIHALSDLLTAKDREEAFQFFCDHVERALAERAREAALQGQLERADALARLATRTGEDLATAEAFNLDRKQTILSLFSSILQVRAA